MAELTDDRKLAVVESWAIIRAQPLKYGPELFHTFFTNFPAHQELFKDFRGVPLDEIKKHPKLRTHGTRVIYVINSLVDLLDELSVAAGIMQKTVEDHHARGIGEQHFKDLFVALFKFLTEHANLDDKAVEGWTIVRDVLMGVVHSPLEELKQ